MPPNMPPVHCGSSPVWVRVRSMSLFMPRYWSTSCWGSTSPRNWGAK